MENKIAFTYMPYEYFESYKNVITNVRKYYPDSDIMIYFDDNKKYINKYIDVAKEFNCTYYIREKHYNYIYREDDLSINLPKIQESCARTYNTCLNSEAEWIMMLEDDVLLKRQIKSWPHSDCGTNREYFKIGGGAIFKREKFKQAYENLREEGIENIIKNHPVCVWAGDELYKEMLLTVNCSYEKWIELAEPEYCDDTDHAVFHGYKDLHKLD